MEKQKRFPIFACYDVLMVALSAYVVLDTFVIQKTFAVVSANRTAQAAQARTSAQGAVGQETDAQGDQETQASPSTKVNMTTHTYNGTTIYVADVYADSATSLFAAFANDSYGRNVSATTSEIASSNGALLAINGDCYGMRNAGYVVRNGVLYRSESAGSDQEDLVICADGTFRIIREGDVSAQELVDAGAWQVLSFGPGLVENGTVTVQPGEEVGRAKASNPRTALGKVSDGHYVFVVSDGRTDESEGLSLSDLATFMTSELGVECAYNLDGGGSSTMVFEGNVVNKPTSSGNSIKEREVTDIVYLV